MEIPNETSKDLFLVMNSIVTTGGIWAKFEKVEGSEIGHTHIHARTRKHTHTHTHTHTHEQHGICLSGNIISFSYQFFLLACEAFVNSSCKFPQEAITIVLRVLKQHDMLYSSCMEFVNVLFTLYVLHPYIFVHPSHISTLSHQIQVRTHDIVSPVESLSVQRPRRAGLRTAKICCTAMYRNVTFQLIAVY